jgi:hypothetical protein
VSAALSAGGAVVAALLPRHTPQMEVSARLASDERSPSPAPVTAIPETIK